jgi:hypothetical protein
MLAIITRKEARARGLSRYFTGEACKNGHVCERQTKGCFCLKCHASPHKRKKREVKPVPPTLPTVRNVRAVIVEAAEQRWRVRCDDGKLITVDIGDVEWQRTNVPLMVVGAIVEFDLVDGDFAYEVGVVT